MEAPDRYSGSIFVVPAHKPRGYAAAQFASVCMFSLYFNHECIFFCCGNLLNVLRHIDNREIMLYTCIINQGNEEMNNKSSNPAKLKRSEDQGNGAADVANALIFF